MNPTSSSRLPGQAATDYERYLRTEELFALQKSREEVAHPDEFLFLTVHQTAELWLRQVARELAEACGRLVEGNLSETARWLGKARDSFDGVADATRQLRHLSPSDYRAIRPNLGNGSGFDSPGFRMIRRAAAPLREKLAATMDEQGLTLNDVLAERPTHKDFHAIIERMLDLDQQLAEWRHTHYLIVRRLLGENAIGLQGAPAEQLLARFDAWLFPELWENRTSGSSALETPALRNYHV